MGQQFPYHQAPVHPALRPYVTSLTAYDVCIGSPGVHHGLPSTSLTFVLPVGEPLDVAWTSDPASRARRWTVVSGLHVAPAAIHHDGWQAGVQLALTAAGSRALFGMPSAALARQLVELTELVGPGTAPETRSAPGLRHLPEQLHTISGWPHRLRLVQQALLGRLAQHDAPGPRAEVGRALASLTRNAPVASVADDVGWSRRHLTNQFRAEYGVSPKQFQRIARFERSRNALHHAAGSGRVRLAELAIDQGYADQAHLTREWAQLAGCTPRTWLHTEFPFLQEHEPSDQPG